MTPTHDQLEARVKALEEALRGLLNATYAHECGGGGKFFSTYQRHARNVLAEFHDTTQQKS